MKFSILDLIAFGPFEGTVLDFSRGNHGLHLVYGPNEAGKSSALRAVRQVLYGIDERTADNFLHPNPKLRIGATLVHTDGNQLTFLRRKGRKDTLRTPDDKKVVPDRRLEPFLAGLGSDVFSTMFGIDHAELESGGRLMLEGEGELGQILFAAGSGVSGLRSVQQELQQELDALYKPRGRNQRLNGLLAEFEAQKKCVRDESLADSEWLQHDRALRDRRGELQRIDDELKQAEGQKNRLDRIRAALPAMSRWKQVHKDLESVRDAVLLPEDFAARHREAEDQLRLSRHDHDAAARRVETIEQQLGELPEPGPLLDAVELIDELHSRLQVHRKAMNDLPRLVSERDQLRSQAEALLRELRPDLTLERAGEAFLPTSDRQRIRQLGTKKESISSRLQEAERNLELARGRLARLEEELQGMQSGQDVAPLQQLLRRILGCGNFDALISEAAARLAETEQAASSAVDRLPGFSGTVDEASRLPVPELKTVERFQKAFTTSERQVEQQQSELDRALQNLERADKKIANLLKAGDVPTEQALQQQRGLRDRTWKLIRRVWRDHLDEQSPEVQQELASAEAPAELADLFEQRIATSDQLADRLREEAERVSKLAQLREERDHHAEEVARLQAAVKQAEDLLAEVEARWTELWEPLGVAPLPPAEMLGWLARHQEIVKLAEERIRRQARLSEVTTQAEQARSELQAALRELGEPPAEADESLTALVDRAQIVADRLGGMRQVHEERRRQLDETRQTLPVLEHEVAARRAELDDWQSQWTAAVARLGLTGDALPAEAEALLEGLQSLASLVGEADKLDRSRIQGIEADARRFSDDVTAAVDRLAPELVSQPLEAVVAELHRRATQARSVAQQRHDLTSRREAEQTLIDEKATACAQLEAELHAMCGQAGVSSFAELPDAEQQSERRRTLERELQQLVDEILHHSGGMGFDEFLADAASVDSDTLDLEIDRLAEQSASLQDRRDEVRDAIKAAEHALAAMDGGCVAADAAVQLQNVEAAVATAVEEYVPLRLALEVLKKGMERYQEQHRGPVLERAGRLFAELTCGSFEGLEVDVDPAGKQVLVGVRAGTAETQAAEKVPLAGMSDGTADQLYLALRLASLSEYLDSHEPLPFIVDDILVDFDDARSAAALQALAELSQRTQVIFFTHHRHLVEIARQVVPAEALFVHQLGGNGAV